MEKSSVLVGTPARLAAGLNIATTMRQVPSLIHNRIFPMSMLESSLNKKRAAGLAGAVSFSDELRRSESGYRVTGTVIGTYHVVSTGERGTWEASLVNTD